MTTHNMSKLNITKYGRKKEKTHHGRIKDKIHHWIKLDKKKGEKKRKNII